MTTSETFKTLDEWQTLKEIDSFMCPITTLLMTDPVSTLDGQSYEREAITEWLENNDTSPSTGELLKDKTLIPNYGLKRAIAEFSEDPARADLIRQLSVRRMDHKEPAFPEEVERIELLIVGPTAVGKSSLLRHLRDLKFLEESDSTIGLDVHNHKIATGSKKCNAKIWDTSGQAMFRDTIRTQYRAADCILFVFDVSRPDTLQQLIPYIEDAQASQGSKPKELILVANKIDLRSNTEEEPLLSRGVTSEEASSFAEQYGLSDYREVSARTGANVKITFSRTLAHAAFRTHKQGGVVIGDGDKVTRVPSCPCF